MARCAHTFGVLLKWATPNKAGRLAADCGLQHVTIVTGEQENGSIESEEDFSLLRSELEKNNILQ